MSNFVKKLTDLFGRSTPSVMSRGALGLDTTQSPEVRQIINEMPKSNRQTGQEEKFKNEWNNQTNKQNDTGVNEEEQLKKIEEEKKNKVDGKPQQEPESEEKKPNMFEKLQELVLPQTIYVSHIVKRHMERKAEASAPKTDEEKLKYLIKKQKKLQDVGRIDADIERMVEKLKKKVEDEKKVEKKAFDNPDPDADPQEDLENRMLDPENPEYKRRKGFGKPYGDIHDGGELKCNVPAVAWFGMERVALTEEDETSILNEIGKVRNWKQELTPTIRAQFPKNYYLFKGTKPKKTYSVVVRSQDTYDEGSFAKPLKVTLRIERQDPSALLSGRIPQRIEYFFNKPDEANKFLE